MTESWDLWAVAVLSAGVRAGVPLCVAALGEVFAEKSGVINLGIEGLMLVSALSAVAVTAETGSAALGVCAAALVAALLAGVFAILTVMLRAGQIPCGIGFIFLGSGLSAFSGTGLVGRQIPGVQPLNIPLVAEIPWLGPILFEHNAMVYLAYVLIPLAWFLMYRTRWGLHVRAVGDDPVAAEQCGVNVRRIRIEAVLFGGCLAGIAGAYLSVAYTQLWVENMVAGRGLIAVALVIFASWHPVKVALGALLFGTIGAFQLRLQASGINASPYLLSMLPYALTILVLIYASARSIRRPEWMPRALGKAFVPST